MELNLFRANQGCHTAGSYLFTGWLPYCWFSFVSMCCFFVVLVLFTFSDMSQARLSHFRSSLYAFAFINLSLSMQMENGKKKSGYCLLAVILHVQLPQLIFPILVARMSNIPLIDWLWQKALKPVKQSKCKYTSANISSKSQRFLPMTSSTSISGEDLPENRIRKS